MDLLRHSSVGLIYHRVLACGGRDFLDKDEVFDALDWLHAVEGIGFLMHGGARGADRLAASWATYANVPVRRFNADWNRFKKAAGPIRNAQMLVEGRPTIIVAFPGRTGTADMMQKARAANIRVWEPLSS